MMRILLIEDDETVAALICHAMRAVQHEVVHVLDAARGKEAALSAGFDVLILDRHLPGGIDGMVLLQDLRAAKLDIPALILSGTGGLHAWLQGLECGGDDYIDKPFKLDELRARVEALHHLRATAGADH